MREQIQREQLQHHQQGIEAKLSALSAVGLNNCRVDKVWKTCSLLLFYPPFRSSPLRAFSIKQKTISQQEVRERNYQKSGT